MNIDFDKMGGLVPAIVQDRRTLKVLMLGFMNREAYQKTVATGLVTFWSRTRQQLWTKGETSGNVLHVEGISADCDGDTLLIKARPEGPTCHKGTDTCWAEGNVATGALFLSQLQDFIDRRRDELPKGSYTTRLFTEGMNKMAQKVGEEAVETIIEATTGDTAKLTGEAADLMYHLMVMLSARGLHIDDIATELRKRHDPQWDAERRRAKANGETK